MMIAKYERGKSLNVREAPSPAARVVRQMRPGEEAECLEIRDGWAKLKDGFANVALLVVKASDALRSVAEAMSDAAVAAQEGEQPEVGQELDDEAEALRKMTNPQLYDLAEQSGIKVRKGAKKDEIIAALLADD